MIQIDENTILEVGKYYLVPCAKMVYESGKALFIPVIGIEHTDKQFAFTKSHYHIDGRFQSDTADYAFKVNEKGKTNAIVCTDNKANRWPYPEYTGVEYKRRKCKRLTTGLDISEDKPPERFQEWEKTYEGRSCKGKKCPHLGTTMHEINGELVCPLHNLRGDILTEIILPPKSCSAPV